MTCKASPRLGEDPRVDLLGMLRDRVAASLGKSLNAAHETPAIFDVESERMVQFP